jgi:hypothetical protein
MTATLSGVSAVGSPDSAIALAGMDPIRPSDAAAADCTSLVPLTRSITRSDGNGVSDRYTSSSDGNRIARYRPILLAPDDGSPQSQAAVPLPAYSFPTSWSLMTARSAAAQYWFYANLPTTSYSPMLSVYA